jgi:LPXTG-motif cell wall-anchored protein
MLAAIAMLATGGIVAAVSAPNAHAVVANGGNGNLRTAIDWFSWDNLYKASDNTAVSYNGPGVNWVNSKPIPISPLPAGEELYGWSKARQVGPGQYLRMKCDYTPSAQTDPINGQARKSSAVYPYDPGHWSGDALPHLYNIDGVTSRKMIVGLATTAGPTKFAFTCNAYEVPAADSTAETSKVNIAGLVFADAEQNNWASQTQYEYIDAIPQGDSAADAKWHLVDTAASCTRPSSLAISIPNTTNGIRMRSSDQQCAEAGGYGPGSVMFMQGANSAQVTLSSAGFGQGANLTGQTAIALGVVLPVDYGDAPQSYGTAGALLQNAWSGGELGRDIVQSADPTVKTSATDTSCTNGAPCSNSEDVIGNSSFVPNFTYLQSLTSPRQVYNLTQARAAKPAKVSTYKPVGILGSYADAEDTQQFSDDATGDDTAGVTDLLGHVINDEDGLKASHWGQIAQGKETYTVDVNCQAYKNTHVAAWVDWNLNGVFDPGEKSSTEPQCTGNSSTATQSLSWVVPDAALRAGAPPQTFMRIRAANQTDIPATGVTTSGEVEDYMVKLPQLTLQKAFGAGGRYSANDQFKLSIADSEDASAAVLATTAGSGSAVTSSPATDTVLPGRTYVLTETGAGTPAANLANYGTPTLSCMVGASSITATKKSDTQYQVTIPNSPDTSNPATIACTFTNTIKLVNVTWSKTDATGGALLSGSEWKLSWWRTGSPTTGAPDQTYDVVDCIGNAATACSGKLDQNQAAGKFQVNNLPVGQYRLTETKAPDGYELLTGTYNPLQSNPYDFGSIANTRKPGSVSWEKTDESNPAHDLAGSEWKITGPSPATTVKPVVDCVGADKPSAAACAVDTDQRAGHFTVGSLAWGDYTLVETKAPAGYELPDASKPENQYSFTISATHLTATINDGKAITNKQQKPVTLPLTGGMSTDSFIFGGSALVIVSIGVWLALRRRNQLRA